MKMEGVEDITRSFYLIVLIFRTPLLGINHGWSQSLIKPVVFDHQPIAGAGLHSLKLQK
jgi:hypothetical protein